MTRHAARTSQATGNALVFPPAAALSGPMAHDPHAEFDHHVLEMIEHSPIGAVPRTPAYQDALGRLCASHQVYADADHADGFVTVRSLARRPCFHARNLEAWGAGASDGDALEPNAAIFDRYVAALPLAFRAKADTYRPLVAGRPAHHRKHGGVLIHEPVHTLMLVPGAGAHPGIPGNYLYGWLLELDGAAGTGGWAIHLHDRDDGAAMCDTPTLADALAKLQEVIASAPFHLSELDTLGFRPN